MLRREARVVGTFLRFAVARTSNPIVADVGSSSLEYRTIRQPYVQEKLFEPISEGAEVIHIDTKRQPGVDLVADVTSPLDIERIRATGANVFLVSNLLEHVTSPNGVARSIAGMVRSGQFLILSGPKNFPYHADPIDNMFRPRRREIEELFTDFSIRDWKVAHHMTQLGSTVPAIRRTPRLALSSLWSSSIWAAKEKKLVRLFLPVSAWCALLQKK